MNYEPLNRALGELATPVFPSSFEDIYSQYKEQHGRAAIGLLATAVTGKVPASKSGFTKGSAEYKSASREYASARRQIERHVTGQYKNFSDATQNKLKEIGQTLNPIRKELPGQGVKIEIKFKSDGDGSHSSRNRTATIEMSGPELYDYANDFVNGVKDAKQPQYADLFDLWFDDGGDVYGEDGDYEGDVTGVTIAA